MTKFPKNWKIGLIFIDNDIEVTIQCKAHIDETGQ